jgi:hypothetical protein
VEALQLAQQATLETRDAKHEPRTLTEQRTAWHAQAAETLGGPDSVQAMINHALNPDFVLSPAVDAEWMAATAEKVLAAVEERRSTWQSWHVRAEAQRAEAQRHIRAVQVPTGKVEQLVELLVTEVLQTRSISLARPDDGITEPVVLRRSDGSSVYKVAGSELPPPPASWPPSSDSSPRRAAATAASWTPALWGWRCWNRPPTAMP